MEAGRLEKLAALVAGLSSEEELQEATNLLNQQWDRLIEKQLGQFQSGDRVRWTHKGRPHCGTVLKRNRKTVSVREDGGPEWRIGPGALTLL